MSAQGRPNAPKGPGGRYLKADGTPGREPSSPRGLLRMALDRDLAKLRETGALRGRDTLVRAARDLADRYDQTRPDDLDELLAILDRLSVGKVPLFDPADSVAAFKAALEGID